MDDGVLRWARFEGSLCMLLSVLEIGAQLVVSVDGTNRYVQFIETEDGLLAEVTGQQFLPPPQRYGDVQLRELTDLGWQPADDLGPNWWAFFDSPVDYAEPAQLAVTTLIGVFGVGDPDRLSYRSLDAAEGELTLPGLGLEREVPGPALATTLASGPAAGTIEAAPDPGPSARSGRGLSWVSTISDVLGILQLLGG